VRELLHIPQGKELICVLSIGYPAQKGASQRRKLNDIVHMEQYGNRTETQTAE